MASIISIISMFRPSVFRQNFPGKPQFTEKDIPDLKDKVYIVSGSNTGVGKELARILYAANATVYLACRTESKAQAAITSIREAVPASTGRLEFLHLDLADLRTIKPAVEAFTAKEAKLHVLFNNAGVMAPPPGQKTVQGYEMTIGTNCVGPFLFTKLLTPTLVKTAKEEPKGSVRIVWVSSAAVEMYSPKNGVNVEKLPGRDSREKETDPMEAYGVSKAGNYMHAVEFARRYKDEGIVSVATNPGALDTDLYRTVGEHTSLTVRIMGFAAGLVVYPSINGAYTELFSGLSQDVTMERSGAWIAPWGCFLEPRSDVGLAGKPEAEGGLGVAEKFWEWSEEQVKEYV